MDYVYHVQYVPSQIVDLENNMRKLLIVLSLLCTILLNGCSKENDKLELTIFAASSLSETLTEIAELYQEVDSNVSLVFNFDSSGTLKTQIEEGADCDLFISASFKQINELEAYLEPSMALLENKVTLAVSEDNPKNIQSYEDLVKALDTKDILLAIGNADVPVGQYTQKIFAYYQLDEEALSSSGCITYGSNAKEVTTQVAESVVDCGIVYKTDAYSANLKVVDEASLEICGQVLYLAAILKESQNKEAAQAFLTYLRSEDASAVFEKVGFTFVK